MDRSDHRPPFPPSERVDSGPLVELRLTRDRQPVFVDHAFSRLDVRLGEDQDTPPIEIVSGLDWPQLHARYVIVQEKVMRDDPRRGWGPVGGAYPASLLVGPSDAGQLDFAAAVGKDDGLLVCAHGTFLSVTACGSTVATVRVGVADLLTVAEASSRRRERALAA